MLRYIRGKVIEKKDSSIVLENQGIGFEILCSPQTISKIKLGVSLKVYVFLYIKKEGEVELYGFLNPRELNLFEMLNNIPRVGPRTASLLAAYQTPERLKEALESPSFQYKGVGRKKIQKVLLELTGEIKRIQKEMTREDNQLIESLVSLGFSRRVAKETLSKIPPDKKSIEEKLKAALQILGQRR